MAPHERPVYETGRGRLCAGCGQPLSGCRCSAGADEPVPARLTCSLRLEKKGRAGKAVTVVAGLPHNREFLQGFAVELKRACGTGGTATAGGVEVQGDQRERLRSWLAARGHVVKG